MGSNQGRTRKAFVMCSIYGGFGPSPSHSILARISERARDRGRDGGNWVPYDLANGLTAILGNWRACPTTEVEKGRLQPYEGLVHNGTIANDRELGGQPHEIDSEVLARVIDRRDIVSVYFSLQKVKGSYALAFHNGKTVFLARNYKPLYYLRLGDNVYFSSLARHFQDVVPFGSSPVEMPAYSILDLSNPKLDRSRELPRDSHKTAVVVCSGGLDSTVVASKLIHDGYKVILLHFSYGCRAGWNEQHQVAQIATALECDYKVITLPLAEFCDKSKVPLLHQSSEISKGIAGSEYAHEWVPARNLLMLSMASAFAEARGAHYIAIGNNLEESGAYPDNEEEMTILFDRVLNYAVQSGYNLRVLSPVGGLMKHEIVKLGLAVDAPLHLTWSCYQGKSKHCGECGPCFMRKTAFARNHQKDPVAYETDGI